jgi:succinate dehydrogenase / fumarate reductase cytochrome b subunit
MASLQRPLSPHLQIYRWQYSNTLSILHRATGLFMTLGVPLLVYWLAAAARGAESYRTAQALFAHSLTKLALLAWLLSFFYHLLNGVRHLVWDMGYGLERPQARASGWLVFIGALVLTVIAAAIAWSRLNIAGELP